ncbi:protein LURP-one-related 5-like [Impatiens glandulifera]|uniref:protein LURP-one-related 5-like n=1 Tax=Impatiens glandulifera TaxID=253017 RepID=UPI001FB164BA|nr:protein LURP-one-related 5-like [Impatiens glandulifera]
MTSCLVLEKGFIYEQETHLTVFKTSLFFAGDGFTVYDCKGNLIFRVDSYGPDSRDKDQIVLMDASGTCLLTVRRKVQSFQIILLFPTKFIFVVFLKQRPSLHQRWEGYKGEGKIKKKKPIFSVRRSSIIGRSSGVTVEVYGDEDGDSTSPAAEEYQIDGSFRQRYCTIMNSEKEMVAEIRRKVDSSTKVLLGKDVFSLCLRPGFDAAFAMGMVLVLDQIYGDYDDDDLDDAEASAKVEPMCDQDD